ncbi:nitrogen permease regulator 2 [[Candida] railenensis]|uniref:Nitrogen permease regulator 2 n=1 Tax=[Candida] railenensis TaxID=45579 RepID=A0A9P0VZI5_9ASCO|nr:nitrogen permease regulator 2 [[Candida] railenensis]
MESNDGFVPILAIFYAVFHPTEGTKIVHQVPEGSISSNSSSSTFSTNPLFNFDTVKNYVIPKPQLCDRLITFKIDRYRVLGYPVNIQNSDYSRNSFNFNFCFVFPYDCDTTPYELCIRRTGKMFRVLEEQSFMLSKLDKKLVYFKEMRLPSSVQEGTKDYSQQAAGTATSGEGSGNGESSGVGSGVIDDIRGMNGIEELGIASMLDTELDLNFINTPGHTKTKKISLSSIESLIQQIFQDLNNYSECCIPLDSANSVDIKLFPILPPPINIKAFQVPLATVNLEQLVDVNWDPTMLKILPFINGLNSIRKISQLADSDYMLTKQCIQHLMHYKCIEIIDIFQFSNIYAPTNHIGNFLRLKRLAAECQAYVITDSDQLSRLPLDFQLNSGTSTAGGGGTTSNSVKGNTPSGNSPSSSKMGLSVSPLTRSSYFQPSNSAGKRTLGGEPGTPKTPQKSITVPSKANLFYLYRSLNQGQTIKEWYTQHRKLLNNIDIRRFINFGVLHGLIYRVHSYPILNKSIESSSDELNELMKNLRTDRVASVSSYATSDGGSNITGKYVKNSVNEANLKTGKSSRKVSFNYNVEKSNRNLLKDIIESDNSDDDNENAFSESDDEDLSTINGQPIGSSVNEMEQSDLHREYLILLKLLRGYQHLDSICTELQKPRSEVQVMLENLGSFSIINS